MVAELEFVGLLVATWALLSAAGFCVLRLHDATR